MFRWFALAALAGCFGISTYYRRRARLTGQTIPRRREGPLLLAARAVVALPLFLAVLAYVVNPRWMAWSAFAAPVWLRWAGVTLGLLAVPAALGVFRAIGRNVSETVLTKDGHELVTVGPYRWIRHPLYATGIILFVGVGLMAASWLVLALAFVVLASIRFVVIPLEERELLVKFGEEYRGYMRRTGALLPRVVRRP